MTKRLLHKSEHSGLAHLDHPVQPPSDLGHLAEAVGEPRVVHAVGFERVELAVLPLLDGLEAAAGFRFEAVGDEHVVELPARAVAHGVFHHEERVDGFFEPGPHLAPAVLCKPRQIKLHPVVRMNERRLIEHFQNGPEVIAVEAGGLAVRAPDARDGHDVVRAYTGGFDVKSDGSRPTRISHRLR